MPKKRKSDKPIDKTLSLQVRMYRHKSGLSQVDLAQEAGLKNGQAVSWVENGGGCQFSTAIRLARALGISLDDVFGLGPYGRGKPRDKHLW